MEIILKQDVANLGYADDIVKVKDGYARNYLIPQGYAELATPARKSKSIRRQNISCPASSKAQEPRGRGSSSVLKV